jgi:hypothetical protein
MDQNHISALPRVVRPIPEPQPIVESALNFSRRHLLASLGLALPAASLIAAEASAATGHKKHHKAPHAGATKVSHRHTKSAAPKPTKS